MAKIAGLVKKAQESGISYGTLKKVYDRGMAAWKTGHRPGTTPQQWAFARVNSYITKGKTYNTADKDLRDTPKEFYSDEDAVYSQVIEIDVAALEPVIAYPFLPENGHSITQAVEDNIKVDQVFVGSCTNGRLSDLKVASEILAGKKIASHTRMIVTPGTQMILREANKLGYIDILVDAGAVVSNPTCGACLGGYMGILGDDEVCISTTNRNFVGRMGSRSSKIYLANSAVAAASAITGYITDPRGL